MDRIDELIKSATYDCMGVNLVDNRQLVLLTVSHCVNLLETNATAVPELYGLALELCEEFGIEVTEDDTD
jgi:hypothetical protein